MNELLHKFKLGNDAELLLEKRGGGYEKVATVPIGSQALGVTQSDQGVVGFPTVGGKTLHGPTLYRRPIVSRCFASSYATVDNSSNLATYVQAIALPCKFDALQIGYVHLGGAGAVTGLKALVAGTDDIGDMTLTNTTGGKKFVTPRRGGVEKNTMTQDGWQAV